MMIGVDKIELILKDQTIRSDRYNYVEGWSRQYDIADDGTPIPMKMKFYAKNRSLITSTYGNLHGNLTIQDAPLRDYTSVIFNPTNLFSEYQLTMDITKAIQKAQDIIHYSGIDLDLLSGTLRRIDITKDRQLLENPIHYNQYLSNYLHMRRASRKMQYPEGMWLGNNSREFTYYHRNLLLDQSKIDHDLPINTARLEFKLKSEGQRSWSEMYNLHKLSDLTDDPDQYQVIYKDGLSNLLMTQLKEEEEEDLSSPDAIRKEMQKYRQRYGRNWINIRERHIGFLHDINNIGLDAYIKAICEVNEYQGTEAKVLLSRKKKEIADMINLSVISSSGRKPIDYIQEIFTKYEH